MSHILVKAPIFDLIQQISKAYPDCGYIFITANFKKYSNGKLELDWHLEIQKLKIHKDFDSFDKLTNFIHLLIASSKLPPKITELERTKTDCFRRMDGDFKGELN